MKRYILGFIIILAIVFGYKYYNTNSTNNSKTNPLLAISKRTTSFFYTSNINSLNNKLDSLSYLDNIKDIFLFSKFKDEIQFIDTLLLNNGIDNIEYKKIVFSANNIGSSKIEYLSIIELDNAISISKIKTFFKSTINEYKYQDFTIYNSTIDSQKIAFSFFNNLIIFSKNSPLVEESLNMLSKKNLKTESDFFKTTNLEKLEDFDIHLFIDFKNSKDLESIVFNNNSIKDVDFENIEWLYSAINFNDKEIDLKTSYSFNKQYNYISNTKPVIFSLDSFLPNNTAYIEMIGSKGNKAFKSDGLSFDYFKDWLDEEIAFFSLENFEENYLKRSGLVLKAKNIDTAKVNLYLLNKEMTPVSKIDECAVYQMNVKAISKLFKSNMVSFTNPYFIFLDKYVIFSDEVSVLRTCKDKYESKNVLTKNKSFKKFIGKNKSNKLVYVNPQRWQSVLSYIFNKKISFTNFGSFKNETFISDSSFYSLGKISFEKEIIQHTTKIWEVNLDANSNFTPQVVINADNQRKELITQDNKNNIYLISQAGEIIFKKHIKEKIIGEIYQIDYYKTNKLQYVFNTKRYIFVMDRNGKIVKSFPLKLPAESANSIFVVNYDNAKKYRYFVACKNGKIYGYNANGNPLKAWSPLGEFGVANNSLKHTTFSDKDFIYFSADGTFYAFNRKGQQRFDAINLGTKFAQPFERTKTGFINFTNGSIYKIDTKGKTTAKILADSSYNVFTNYAEKEAFAIANKNEIRIAKSKWTILGKKTLKDDIVSIEKIKVESKIWFVVNCKKSVYLVNELCEIHPDFPKTVNSKARVIKFYSNKGKLMIYSNKNKLQAFQLVLPN